MENSLCQEQLVIENMEILEYSRENVEHVDAVENECASPLGTRKKFGWWRKLGNGVNVSSFESPGQQPIAIMHML